MTISKYLPGKALKDLGTRTTYVGTGIGQLHVSNGSKERTKI